MKKSKGVALSLALGTLALGAVPVSAENLEEGISLTVPVTDLAVYTTDGYSVYLSGDEYSVQHVYEVISISDDTTLISILRTKKEDFLATSIYLVDDFSIESFKDLSNLEEYKLETLKEGEWTLGDNSGKTVVIVTNINSNNEIDENRFVIPPLTVIFRAVDSDPSMSSALSGSQYGLYVTAQEVLTGDVTGDDKVSIMDLLSLKKGLLGLKEVTTLGDINNDGRVNSADLIQLKKYLLGLSEFADETTVKLIGQDYSKIKSRDY